MILTLSESGACAVMAHPFIFGDLKMWNDTKFSYEMVKYSIDFSNGGKR